MKKVETDRGYHTLKIRISHLLLETASEENITNATICNQDKVPGEHG